MDIDELVRLCPYANNIHRISYDQKIIANVPYIASNNDENICTDLETLYNTVYTVENSYGSSDRYTIPPFLDERTSNQKYKKRREHFEKNDNSLMYIIFFLLLFVVIMINFFYK